MPNALFVHNGSPGRFAFLANALVARGWRCALLNGPAGKDIPGVATAQWRVSRKPTADVFPLAARAEVDFIVGGAAAAAAHRLKETGFEPDVIIGHPGWGEMLFLREVFPKARQIQFGELYRLSHGLDAGFDPEFAPTSLQTDMAVHAKNASLALSYADADRIVVPTPFQLSLFPKPFQHSATVIHEGIDTRIATRRAGGPLKLASGTVLDGSVPVITFANRFLEPLRGFHVFMRTLPAVLEALPEAHVLVIGSDSPEGYGRPPPQGSNWREVLLREVGHRLDAGRVHFVGQLPYEHFLAVLSLSSVHVYLTYPFVLSWSVLDAMACECLVVASDTPPVRDVIMPGENGLLVGFFDRQALAATIVDVCRHPRVFAPLRTAARRTVVERFDRATKCEPAWLKLVDEVLALG